MERKRSSGFRHISTEAFDRLDFRLGWVYVDNCPAGLDSPLARNRRTATVKIRRNPLLFFFSIIIFFQIFMLPKAKTFCSLLQSWNHKKSVFPKTLFFSVMHEDYLQEGWNSAWMYKGETFKGKWRSFGPKKGKFRGVNNF